MWAQLTRCLVVLLLAAACSGGELECLRGDQTGTCEGTELVQCVARGRFALATLERVDCRDLGMVCAGGPGAGACTTELPCRDAYDTRCEPAGTALICVPRPGDGARFYIRLPATDMEATAICENESADAPMP